MNCPNCAAAMDLVSNRTHLKCGHCGTLTFPDPGQDGVVPLDGDHGFDCPVCKVGLTKGGLNGHPVGFCRECRGFLATSEAFAAAVSARRSGGTRTPAPRGPLDPAELQRATKCPRCRRRMDTHPYGGGGPAVIDSCPRCHLVWLDAGELTILGEYAPPAVGGAK